MEPAFASVVKANFLENFSYASMKDRQRSEASKSGEGSRGQNLKGRRRDDDQWKSLQPIPGRM